MTLQGRGSKFYFYKITMNVCCWNYNYLVDLGRGFILNNGPFIDSGVACAVIQYTSVNIWRPGEDSNL